jgi:S1-C subfamily serine protease
VNPGSSGAPLFNDRGLVVGMVAAKAGIEATGFAIPADEITRFLVELADKTGERKQLQRSWRDIAGKYSFAAKLKAVEADRIILIRADTTEQSVPRAKLCEADQDFANLLDSPAGSK